MRDTIGQQDARGQEKQNRRTAFNCLVVENMLLHEVMQDIRDLRMHLIGNAMDIESATERTTSNFTEFSRARLVR